MNAVLLVARNNIHLTKRAVASILAQNVPVELIVINNFSADGTSVYLRGKNIAQVNTPYQMSLAACWYYGLRHFKLAGATEVLVVNNDVELRPDTFTFLHNCYRSFVSGVSVDSLDQLGTVDDRSFLECNIKARPNPDFSCFLMDLAITDQIGWFDESYYPAYCEDCDYHVRMHRAGIWAGCVDLPFYHAAAQTLKNADEGEQARIRRGADANRERFRQKYGCLPGTPEYAELFK